MKRKPPNRGNAWNKSRNEAYLEVLGGSFDGLENALFELAWDIVSVARRQGKIVATPGPDLSATRLAMSESDLRTIVLNVSMDTMRFAIVHWGKAVRRLIDQEEHSEMLAAEGQAVKAENDKERSAKVCKLYESVRPSFPEGPKGNGDAHRAVKERFEATTDKSITVKTVRNILKKAGLAQSLRRKGKH